MRIFLVLIGFALFGVSPAFSDAGTDREVEYKMIAFDVCWRVSNNMALGESISNWLSLKVTDPAAAKFVASFWFTKCHMEFHGYWDSVMKKMEEKNKREIDSNPKLLSDKKAMAAWLEGISQTKTKEEFLMLQCFCYDHAAEIKSMIDMRLDLAIKGESSTQAEASPARAEANEIKSAVTTETPPASPEARKIQSRLEELRQLREKNLKPQETALPKAVQDP